MSNNYCKNHVNGRIYIYNATTLQSMSNNYCKNHGGFRYEIAFCLFIICLFFISFPADAVSSAGSFFPIAQIPATTPAALGSWLIQFMSVMVIVIAILQIISFFRRKPPIDAEFATKAELRLVEEKTGEELTKVGNAIGALSDQIRKDYDNIQRSGEARASGIHKRINEFVEGFGAVRGQVELLAKRFGVCEK